MAMIELKCFECGTAMSFVDVVSRRDECPKCGADARVCKNCQFYDPKAYNECRESSADPVREKDRSNLCDYFSANSKGKSQSDSKEALLAAAEALFKKK